MRLWKNREYLKSELYDVIKSMENTNYVHGYSYRESMRLNDQAGTLDHFIHNDTVFPDGSFILEAGCGVGAQTQIIASKNPNSTLISIDISEESLLQAQKSINLLGIKNVVFQQADIFKLPFEDEYFDNIVVCFVLEHLNNPILALKELKRVLKTGGTIMTIEGDHGSTFFHPHSENAILAINCQVELQKQNGGNANIGRELYPLLKFADLNEVFVSPRMIYVDGSQPTLAEEFIKNTFTAMIEGVEEKAVEKGLIDRNTFKEGINDLYRTAESDGMFSYTFFKAFATKSFVN